MLKLLMLVACVACLSSRAATADFGREGLLSSSPCIAGADTTSAYVRSMEAYVSNTDSSALASVGVPYRPAAGVTVVTDTTVCAQVMNAVNATVAPGDTLGLVSRGIVLKLGTTAYSFSPQDGNRLSNVFYFLNTQFQIVHRLLAI